MTTYALRLENGTDTAARARMADLLGLTAGTTALTSRGGLRPDGGGVVTVTNGAMSVSVSPFVAWVQGGVSAVQGGYPFVSDAAVILQVAAGDASQVRTDTVVALVRDNAYDGSGLVKAEVAIIQGAPGAGAPSLPINSVALWDVVVPAGRSAGNGGLAASNLGADRRRYVVGAGGVLPVATQAERDALQQVPGLSVYRRDTDRVETRTTAGWVPVTANEVNVWRQMSANNTWANQTSFGVLPVAADRAASTVTMVKTSATTALAVNFDASQALNSGGGQQLVGGLRINGTDYMLAIRHTGVAAPLRVDLHATRRLTGIPAGTLTIEPVFATSSASQVIMYASDDVVAFTVREVA